MKRQPNWWSFWIALLLLTPLTGCVGNLTRRIIGVEQKPKRIDLSGIVVEAVEKNRTSSQHPVTWVFYLDFDMKPGCFEIKGQDLNRARNQIKPFGTFTAKRTWDQPTLMGFGCPKVGPWKGSPNKTKSGKIDEDDLRAFLWTEVRRQILLLAPAQIKILGDLFWPKEIPAELNGVFPLRQSTVSAPPRLSPAVSLQPVTVPAEDLSDEEMSLELRAVEAWYQSLTPEEKIEFHEATGIVIGKIPKTHHVSAAVAFAEPWSRLDGFHVHETIVVNTTPEKE